jgi:hypothetical protein
VHTLDCPHVTRRTNPTATGHVVGRSYMSTDAGVAYVVERVATLWDLAADGAVAIRWANGHRAITNRPRGADPELCPRCHAAPALT